MGELEGFKFRRHDESNLQMSCVRWFRLQYPEMAGLLFAVPNGSKRGKVTAAILKAEGALAGVSDLLFLMPEGTCPYLCIEMMTKTGRQSPAQKEFQNNVEDVGARYALVRSFDEFVSLIRNYVKG
jgi:hypothetical protein